jgi:hypothetical protein
MHTSLTSSMIYSISLFLRKLTLTLLAASVSSIAINADNSRLSNEALGIKVRQVFEEIENNRLSDWEFSVQETVENRVYDYTFLPIVDGVGEIRLNSIDGEKPTEKELEKFHKKHPPRNDEPRDPEADDSLYDMIVPGTLELIEAIETVYRFKFQPRMDMGKDEKISNESLKGLLEYNASDHVISSFKVWSEEPFKPRSGVKVKEMNMDMAFQRLDPDTLAIASMHMRFQGRAFLVASFDQQMSQRYYGFNKPSE